MFTRGRQCLRRRDLSAVLDNVVAGPEEPLLFLYPRWFTSAVRQQRSIASINNAIASTKRSNGSTAYTTRILPRGVRVPRRLSFGRGARRWLSSDASVAVEDTNKIDRTDGVSEQDVSSTGSSEGDAARREESPSSDTVSSPERKRPNDPFSDAQTIDTPQPPPTNHSTGRTRGKTHKRLLALPLNPREKSEKEGMKRLSVRDRRKLRYRLFLAKRMSDEVAKRAWTQLNDVKELLERLHNESRVWTRKGTKHVELLIPEETVALLAGISDMAMNENIWIVHVRNGCRVHVLHPMESEGRFRKIILSGSERVVELVIDQIKRAQSLQARGDPLVEIMKPPFPVFPSIEAMRRRNVPVPLVRGVWDINQTRHSATQLDALKAFEQGLANVREFAEHIDAVTRSQPSPHRNTDGRPNVPHPKRVAKTLVALFKNEANHHFISTAALNKALSYLCKHEFLRPSRAIFLRAEHVATVETFNIFLKSAAKRQDIRVFRRFLLAMSRAPIRPNEGTWLAFLDCLVSPKAKASLVSQILQNGYIKQTSAVRSMLQLTIQDTFLAHLESGQSVDSFFNVIQSSPGANWFPPSLLNQMFSVTARMKDFESMKQLLEICNREHLEINSSTLNQILLLFRNDIFSALEYVYRCTNHPVSRLNKETWERLFMIAFKGRHYNICRVVWRYACLNQAVTYKMRKAVTKSLAHDLPLKNSNDYENIWRTSAGNVIFGINFEFTDCPIPPAIMDEIPPIFRKRPHLYLTRLHPKEEEREFQRRLATALTQRDIELGRQGFTPSLPFPIMLEAAALLDQEWKGIPRPVTWTTQNAISVPVRRPGYIQKFQRTR